MDTLPSTEFRKRYRSLTEPTRVTVNGHPIGIWSPTMAVLTMEAPDEKRVSVPEAFDGSFTPVPEPRKAKR